MKLALDRKRLIAYTFVALSVSGVTGLIVGARSYYLMYDSLLKLHFNLTKVSFDNSQPSMPTLTLDFQGVNPVDYPGLSIAEVNLQIYFSAIPSNSSLFQDNPLSQPFPLDASIPATGTIVWTVRVLLTTTSSMAISSFRNSHAGETVFANTSYTMLVNSLLQKLSSQSIAYAGQGNVTLT